MPAACIHIPEIIKLSAHVIDHVIRIILIIDPDIHPAINVIRICIMGIHPQRFSGHIGIAHADRHGALLVRSRCHTDGCSIYRLNLRCTEFNCVYMNLIFLSCHTAGNRQRYPCRFPLTSGNPVAVRNPVHPVIALSYTISGDVHSIEVHIISVIHVDEETAISWHLNSIVLRCIHIHRHRIGYCARNALRYSHMH